VKYHLGYSSLMKISNDKDINLKLVPNPSHLEAVGPVVEGFARAKADMLYGNDYDKILPILIHGDAAVAGQGVVFETVQMSGLEGYTTGGTLHFVINNQIGFTTDYDDARTSLYATGVAAVVDAPVFHVNGDDPEAVVYACELALAYRQEFNSDVFIDMLCYRKHGHNEGDDPAYTQPGMYERIKKHDDPRKIYTDRLVQRGDVERKLAEEMQQRFNNLLQENYDEVKNNKQEYKFQEPEQAWRELDRDKKTAADFAESPETGISREQFEGILDHFTHLPEGFQPIKKVDRLFKNFGQMREKDAFDWATGELSAYASLLMAGHHVRISGQDVRRGTFSHRHAILNGKDGKSRYNRLDGLSEDQASLRIYNSLLSEFAVLGFEYGYAMSSPDNLVIWEAQFGDFSNGAQVFFDQFISSAERKWLRMSGLVCLLPHGYEGQGPEHSSARLERFLQMAAEDNMQVCNLTTPANYFHALRRQIHRDFRKPLIIMTPKSLLRHKLATSTLDDLATKSSFHRVLWDDAETPGREGEVKLVKDDKIRRVVLCSGKVYYDLFEAREEGGQDDVYLMRVEQFYPVPRKSLMQELKRFPQAELVWCQEEPRNMGGWSFMRDEIEWCAGHAGVKQSRPKYAGRAPSAATATGLLSKHNEERDALLSAALGEKPVEDSVVSA